MLKGKQAFMGLETHENEATRTHVSVETKQTKIRVSG